MKYAQLFFSLVLATSVQADHARVMFNQAVGLNNLPLPGVYTELTVSRWGNITEFTIGSGTTSEYLANRASFLEANPDIVADLTDPIDVWELTVSGTQQAIQALTNLPYVAKVEVIGRGNEVCDEEEDDDECEDDDEEDDDDD